MGPEQFQGIRGGSVPATAPEEVEGLNGHNSAFHQQLAEKLYAGVLAQQKGISLSTAAKRIAGPASDTWLMVAEVAELAFQAYCVSWGDADAEARFVETYRSVCQGPVCKQISLSK